MTEQEKNERAFPSFVPFKPEQFGLTILDYFASHALMGILSANPKHGGGDPFGDVVKTSYRFAQAMVKERSRILNEES